ncbi:MAG: hypothetical protein JW731_00660 [Bacteroidales bacterium]|nr:hypothetical protein [Bacteroidales bacterium]
MNYTEIIDWLLDGDIAIQYQVHRDLLYTERNDLRKRIAKEGWGNRYLSLRKTNGHWGDGFYQPKWISTHYTLLDLKNLGISSDCIPIKQTLNLVIETQKGEDGGINPGKTVKNSDVCINGMALNYFCYFGIDTDKLKSIVDFILSQRMIDGGFNCRFNRQGARHSSLHTTISVLEGILEYKNNNYNYRLGDLLEAEETSREFILEHRIFRSDKTGEIIDKRMLSLPFPFRWKYDILRALEYYYFAGAEYDERMQDALHMILKKRNKNGTWKLQANHPGKVHFNMEVPGKPSRWNTLRALRVLKYFEIIEH